MKLVPRLKPCFNYKETLALLNPFNKNNAIERLEHEMAEKFECTYGTMFAHGRSGIYALLKAWGLKNKEIICPAYTCVVVQHAIVLSGNIPVFIDCENDSWNMDLDLVEKSINSNTGAIIATHLFGYPMNVEAIDQLIKKAKKELGINIYTIQDVAHSYGANWNDKLVTTYGDAAVFGMNVSKILSSIFGGMVITKSEELDIELKKVRKEFTKGGRMFKSLKRMAYYMAIRVAFNSYVYGFINLLERKGLLNAYVQYYTEDTISFPKDWDSPPTNTEASVGLVQLKKYDHIIQQRRSNAIRIKHELSENKDIRFMSDYPGATYSHCVGIVNDRNEWLSNYRKKRVQLGILIEYSVPELKAFEKFKTDEYPNAKYFSSHTINFPNWAE